MAIVLIAVYPYIRLRSYIRAHIRAGADQPDNQQVGDEPVLDPPTGRHVLSSYEFFCLLPRHNISTATARGKYTLILFHRTFSAC